MIKWLVDDYVDETLAKRLAARYPSETVYVSHGWIDVHVHLFSQAAYRLDGDKVASAMLGVVGLVDAGSTGYANYQLLIQEAKSLAPREVFLLLNLAPHGISSKAELARFDFDLGEHAAALGHPRVIGTKMRLSPEATSNTTRFALPLKQVQSLSAKTMVHIGNTPPSFSEVLSWLKPGDIITHFYHGKNASVLETLSHAAPRALKDLVLDIGWGSRSFSFARFEQLLALGYAPSTISTDLHDESANRVYLRLHYLMSYFLSAGLSLEEVVAAVTTTPWKRVIGQEHWPNYRQTYTFFTINDASFSIDDGVNNKTLTKLIKPRGFQVNNEVYFHD